MFGFGIYFTRQIMESSRDITDRIDDDTLNRMEELLNDGSRVVIPFDTKTIRRGETAVFGVGILNTLQANTNFRIQTQDNTGAVATSPYQGNAPDGTAIPPAELSKIALLYDTTAAGRNIRNNDNLKYAIAANVAKDAPSGTYITNLVVFYEDPANPGSWVAYGDPLYKLYIVVP